MPQGLRALFLLALLGLPLPAAALPEPWRPEPDAARPCEAMARAKALFEAEARPALIRAGLGTVEEFLREPGGDVFSVNEVLNDTGKISEILWAFYPFPQVQRQLYEQMLETELSPKARLERLGGTVENLLACLQSLKTGRREPYQRLDRLSTVLAFWQNGNEANAPSRAPAAGRTGKKAFAQAWLPLLLQAFQEDAPTAYLAAMEKKGLPAWRPWSMHASRADEPAWRLRKDPGEIAFSDLLCLLWEKRDDPALLGRARDIMEDRSTDPDLRWKLAQLALRFPGRPGEEYARILPLLPGIETMNGSWVRCGAGACYGVSFGGCEGPVFDREQAELLAAPRIGVEGQSGPGLKILALQEPPDLSNQGPLYLLFENTSAAPDFFPLDNANSRPVLTRGAFYYLASGPRLCPLQISRTEHRKLLAWFWSEGAAGGQCALLASRQPVEDMLADLENWNLALWEEKQNDPRPALTLSYGGNFLSALLPRLKGRAAALLFGRVDALWSARVAREGDVLFEVRPEAALPNPSSESGPGKTRPVLVLGGEALSALRVAYAEEQLIRRVIAWQRRYPRSGFTRAQGAAFLEGLSAELRAAHPDLRIDDWKFQRMQELLWRVHGTPLQNGLRALLLRKGNEAALDATLKEAEVLIRANDKKTAKEG